MRTFTLLGTIAGIAGWLATLQMTGASVVLVASAAGIVLFAQTAC